MTTTSFTTAAAASNTRRSAISSTTLKAIIDEIEALVIAVRVRGNAGRCEKALRELQVLEKTLERLQL